jgi:hypothetical protein
LTLDGGRPIPPEVATLPLDVAGAAMLAHVSEDVVEVVASRVDDLLRRSFVPGDRLAPRIEDRFGALRHGQRRERAAEPPAPEAMEPSLRFSSRRKRPLHPAQLVPVVVQRRLLCEREAVAVRRAVKQVLIVVLATSRRARKKRSMTSVAAERTPRPRRPLSVLTA